MTPPTPPPLKKPIVIGFSSIMGVYKRDDPAVLETPRIATPEVSPMPVDDTPKANYEPIRYGDSYLIPLRSQKYTGLHALIDADDLALVEGYRWNVHVGGGGRCNAVTDVWKNGQRVEFHRMHRLIMGTPDGMLTDHINRVTLDNRRSNLRICTTAQNNRNQGNRRNNMSGYRGVTWVSTRRRWFSRLTVDGVTHYLGAFKSLHDAVLAYNQAIIDLGDDFAVPHQLPENIPDVAGRDAA